MEVIYSECGEKGDCLGEVERSWEGILEQSGGMLGLGSVLRWVGWNLGRKFMYR